MEIEAQIRTAHLRAVFAKLPATLAITVVNSVAAATVLAAGGAPPAVWGWLAVVVALAALRAAAWSRFRRSRGATHPELWDAVATGGALASGLAWGLGAALLPMGEAAGPGGIGAFVLLLLLGAMGAGAATVHAVHVPSALAFIVPAGVPLALRLGVQGDTRSLLLATMVLLYTTVLAIVARHSGRHFGETFRLEIELERRARELDAAHAALRAEMDEHRATGEMLRQAQRMEAVGQLTGGIAHDVNNVLAVIGGNLQLIGRQAGDNADILRLVGSAERAAERGARLTASLQSHARERRLRLEEVDLNELVRDFAPMLRRALAGRMELALDLAPGGLVALTDPPQLQAALMQLAIQARDASPPGRRLSIATGLEPQADAAPGPEGAVHAGPFACIRVADTGQGAEVVPGYGLGLSQAYGFARRCGGTARLERPEGGGMAVAILLPAPAAPERDVAAMPGTEEDGFAGRVLLVEDDADVREVLQESLAGSGWQVTPACDGIEARRVLEGDAPLDIVVSDVVMPGGVSGVDLARAAARLRPELPVLLISGYPTATLQAQGADEGELNLMRKPFTHAELLARMRLARQGGGRRPGARPGAARGTASSRAAGG